jgi:signal transduction histidine kinase
MRWLRFRHSLKRRLVLLFLLLAMGSTGLFVLGTRELFSTGWREVALPLAADYLDRLATEIGSPPDVQRAKALVQHLPVSVHIEGPQVQWDSHPGLYAQRQRHAPHDGRWHQMLTRLTPDGHRITFGLGELRWDEQPRWHGWLILAGLLALTGLAYAYVRHLFRPLDDIRMGVQRFGGGDFSQPIAPRHNDELGRLAEQVNAMAASLGRMLEGQRGLLLAISHELRSPLTRARLNSELLDPSAEREALLRDLGVMRDLIADLLESERLAAGGAALHKEPCNLNALILQQIADQSVAPHVTLDLEPSLPTQALDRSRMQLLLRNLLDNAQRHGGGSLVSLQTRVQGDAVLLTVTDAGPGVDEAQLAHLAEPFYRPDAARSRSAGGVGLGLYLCKLVAQSHGGSLAFQNAAPGLRVSLRLPLGDLAPAAG